MPDTTVSKQLLARLFAAFLLTTLPAVAHAVPFSWTIPNGSETWSTDHVHTILWSGGPASPVNIYLIRQPTNTVEQVVTLNNVNDGEHVLRIANGLPPGTYQFYIEDVGVSDWAYGPQFHLQQSEPCIAPCTQGATGSPVLACGATQAIAESLAIARAQAIVGCGMAGNVVPGSVRIETTLLAVGAFPCPAGDSGAYAVEASAIWCCCHEPLPVEIVPWSHLKARSLFLYE